jgi:hypothetical protein
VRDFVVFTNKRLIAVNVQGMTGKKRDFTSLVRLEFEGSADNRQLGHMIASFVL